MSINELSKRDEYLRKRIQNDIRYCLNCQARDSGDWIWVKGERYDLEDLFDDYELSEQQRDRIVAFLECPCGTELNRHDIIGLENLYDLEFQKHLVAAKRKYSKRIKQLTDGIKKYPTLVLSLPLGKSIFKEISAKKLPVCSVEGIFYRARKAEGSKVFEKDDLKAPPLGIPNEGRFNHSGQSCLYVSQTKETCLMECSEDQDSALIWVLQLELNKIENILDLTFDWNNLGPSTSTLLVALHQSSVLSNSDSNKGNWKPDYFLTRYIMDCALMAGYKGILYNSVKDNGKNVVLFEFDNDYIKGLGELEIHIWTKKKKYHLDDLPF